MKLSLYIAENCQRLLKTQQLKHLFKDFCLYMLSSMVSQQKHYKAINVIKCNLVIKMDLRERRVSKDLVRDRLAWKSIF